VVIITSSPADVGWRRRRWLKTLGGPPWPITITITSPNRSRLVTRADQWTRRARGADELIPASMAVAPTGTRFGGRDRASAPFRIVAPLPALRVRHSVARIRRLTTRARDGQAPHGPGASGQSDPCSPGASLLGQDLLLVGEDLFLVGEDLIQ